MIEGIRVHPLKKNCDERGFLMEILRKDYGIFQEFAMVYVSRNYPGVVRAWHYHKLQDDIFCCISGMIKAVVYDAREASPTRGEVHEFFMGEDNPMLLAIPVGVYHGYKTVGTQPSLLLNFPTNLYNPKEPDEHRVAWNDPTIPYNWDIRFT
jgi:dTDP-4-dehydrorhamnose 3,5-epimerase